uniref:RNase H type-1 domain-containing protein n=1 Tax=Cannabis sativa TaxID=3483 RepID=A0A803QFD3_CANSA
MCFLVMGYRESSAIGSLGVPQPPPNIFLNRGITAAKYLKRKEFFNCSYKEFDSWFWKNVVKSKAILKKGACKRVADGRDTRIWGDPWIPHMRNFLPRPNGSPVTDDRSVAELFSNDGGWDIHKLNNLFDRETVSAILQGGAPSGTDLHATIFPLPSPPSTVSWNHLGRVVWVQTSSVDFSDALCGIAATCCLAISTAKDIGAKFVIVESDSRIVTNALNGKEFH